MSRGTAAYLLTSRVLGLYALLGGPFLWQTKFARFLANPLRK